MHDVLSFRLEDTPESPLAELQAAPYINGQRLTVLLGLDYKAPGARQFGEHNIGLEPEQAFLPSTHYLEPTSDTRTPGTTVLLRCSCGDHFCTQVVATVRVTEHHVEWAEIEGRPNSAPKKLRTLRFDRQQYEEALRGPS
jgi:hypothetical protein